MLKSQAHYFSFKYLHMSYEFIIIIPARLNSSRLPNKMMLPIGDKPLIEHTWKQALKARANKTIIATDNEDIYDHMSSVGAEVTLTSSEHETGTDRLAEVARSYEFSDQDIIVNWQGDEPFLPPEYILNAVIKLVDSPNAAMSTLASKINNWDDFKNPNIVKVVKNSLDEALYFSRAPIPFPRNFSDEKELPKELKAMRHIGVYAYRAFFLKQYPTLPQSYLEQYECLEQLRALYNNFIIAIEEMNKIPPLGIDTEEELNAARLWISKQQL